MIRCIVFHTVEDIFSLSRVGKKAMFKANALRTELVKKQKIDEKTNAVT